MENIDKERGDRQAKAEKAILLAVAKSFEESKLTELQDDAEITLAILRAVKAAKIADYLEMKKEKEISGNYFYFDEVCAVTTVLARIIQWADYELEDLPFNSVSGQAISCFARAVLINSHMSNVASLWVDADEPIPFCDIDYSLEFVQNNKK